MVARGLIALAALLSAGCGDVDQVFGPPSEAIPLPPPAGEANFPSAHSAFEPAMQWSPDGRTIYYLSFLTGSVGVRAFDLQTAQTRVLVTAEATSFQVLRITNDGSTLFYSMQPHGSQLGHGIYRLATGGGEPVQLVTGADHRFGISPDGRMLAWNRYGTDSLFMRDLSLGATQFIGGHGGGVSVSADYTQVVHGWAGALGATDLITGSTTHIQRGVLHHHDMRWGDQGLEVLNAGYGRMEIVRGNGAGAVLWGSPEGMVGSVGSVAWSRDGTRIAIADGSCLFGIIGCSSALWLIDLRTGSRTELASAPGFLSRPLFSADGEKLALTAGGRLHVLTLP